MVRAWTSTIPLFSFWETGRDYVFSGDYWGSTCQVLGRLECTVLGKGGMHATLIPKGTDNPELKVWAEGVLKCGSPAELSVHLTRVAQRPDSLEVHCTVRPCASRHRGIFGERTWRVCCKGCPQKKSGIWTETSERLPWEKAKRDSPQRHPYTP